MIQLSRIRISNFFPRFAWPIVAIGGLLATACLASTWYINRLQTDMAKAIQHDVARLDAADQLQVHLRQLRSHSVIFVADPTEARQHIIDADFALVKESLESIRSEITPDDAELFSEIEIGYEEYKERLGRNRFPSQIVTIPELVRWSDAHPVHELLVPCRKLSDRQRHRMNAGLASSEAQTAWAGGLLLALGVVGAFGGLLSGYATARGVIRQAARLSVHVQAVHAQLDQEVGAMTVEGPPHAGDLDAQLDMVVGRVKDVCERLQEQERDLLRAEQLAAVGHLAAGVAHEVRNPLTGIKILVEGTLRPVKPAPLATDDLQLIRHEILRIERTIQGLLNFARTPPPNRYLQDVRDLVNEAVGVARGRAEAKSVALCVASEQLPISALVDHDQMISLLTNLLYNAIDATPPHGEVGVEVATTRTDILVKVTDTGSGIDPAIKNRLFTPFATTKPTGTGLGLTVARRVAKDHGGSLIASNQPSGGACFTLALPYSGESNVETPRRG